MTAIVKKLRKIAGDAHNAVAIDPDIEAVEALSAIFQSVFVYTEKEHIIKKRNIIYRQELDDLTKLPDISMIYIGMDAIEYLSRFNGIIEKYKSLIVIPHDEHLDKTHTKWLTAIRYEIIYLAKRLQIWKYKT
jgi:ubiquinone biosynthesis protein Coq4